MLAQTQLPLTHSNQYSADSACGHCDGVIRHEPWCITQNPSVHYAYEVVLTPLLIRALGIPKNVRRSPIANQASCRMTRSIRFTPR
jgi:hypothetical protein